MKNQFNQFNQVKSVVQTMGVAVQAGWCDFVFGEM